MSELEEKARMIAEFLHDIQKYGDSPYIVHLDLVHEVLKILDIQDEELLASSYLHDALEDCNVHPAHIEKYFNKNILELVQCVTDESGRNRKERHLKTYPKIKANPKARKLKLADRIANVEFSLGNSRNDYNPNLGKLKMYHDEYEEFKELIFVISACDKIELEMWNHLNKLDILSHKLLKGI